ncbi:unnamed protein product [Cercospora beticola]|nr:unnamed protein product [Cercospora beticola]
MLKIRHEAARMQTEKEDGRFVTSFNVAVAALYSHGALPIRTCSIGSTRRYESRLELIGQNCRVCESARAMTAAVEKFCWQNRSRRRKGQAWIVLTMRQVTWNFIHL